MMKNISALFFGLFLCLLFVEIFFRIFAIVFSAPADPPDPNAYRILCIGDSSTFGFGTDDPGRESYPARLKQILQQSNEKAVQVFNCALPGINSSQALRIFKKEIQRLQPHLVLICAGVNDPWNLIASRVLEFYEGPLAKKILLRSVYYLQQLKLFRFLYLNWVNLRSREPQKEPVPDFDKNTVGKNQILMSDPVRFEEALIKNWENNFMEFFNISRERGCLVFFLEYHNEGWMAPVKIIHSLYSKLALPVIPLFDIFQDLDKKSVPVRANDAWHPNAKGYSIMAREVLKTLRGKIPLNVSEEDIF